MNAVTVRIFGFTAAGAGDLLLEDFCWAQRAETEKTKISGRKTADRNSRVRMENLP